MFELQDEVEGGYSRGSPVLITDRHMSDHKTCFKAVDYSLVNLLTYIEVGAGN